MEEKRFPIFTVVLCVIAAVCLLFLLFSFNFEKPANLDDAFKNFTVSVDDEDTESITNAIEQGKAAANAPLEIMRQVDEDTEALRDMLTDALSD